MLKRVVTALCCGLSFMVSAAQVTDLYQGKAPTSGDMAAAQSQALGEVLIKVTGKRDILTQPAVVKALATPGEFVQHYGYQDVGPVKFLKADFDVAKVNALVAESKFALLGPARPQVAIWLVINEGERRILPDQSNDGWAAALRTQAQAMGLPVSQEEEQPRRWIWWLLAPLALVMGAAANYGWHLLNNRPIEKMVEVKEVVTPPFVRVEPRPMITRPLPPPPPEPVVIPKADAQPAPAPADSSQGLAERILNALNNTPLQQSTPPQVPAELQATPLSALPQALRQQVPPLAYGAHVFSSNPANRAVTLNGRTYREGSEVAPGVTLLTIAQDYIILQVGGQNVSLKALQDWLG